MPRCDRASLDISEAEAGLAEFVGAVVHRWWEVATVAMKKADHVFLRNLGREFNDEIGEAGVKVRAQRLTEVGADTELRYERVLQRWVMFIARADFGDTPSPLRSLKLAMGAGLGLNEGVMQLAKALITSIQADTLNKQASCAIRTFITAASLCVEYTGAMPVPVSASKTRAMCAALLYAMRLTIVMAVQYNMPIEEVLQRGDMSSNTTFRAIQHI